MFPNCDNQKAAAADSTTLFKGYRLESAFQPIYGLSHKRAVGFEALVRTNAAGGEPASPAALFQSAETPEELLALDDQCQALHIANFARQAPPDRWLFLNIEPATILSGRYRESGLVERIAAEGLGFSRVVVEIVEGAIADESLLFDAVDYFKSLGALVALDDFGTGHSNFDRIWRLAPDIIKLDRSIIVEAEQHHNGTLRQMLPNLIALMHEAGSLVLVEGVETEEQVLIALGADADFVQGFYFAYPQARMAEGQERHPKLDGLNERFTDTVMSQDQEERQILAPYIAGFRNVLADLVRGHALQPACQSLLAMTRTARCFLLNRWGEQIAHYSPAAQRMHVDKRFDPVVDTTGGTWFRRPYFRQALNNPKRLQVSRPYLSNTGSHMCVTLSNVVDIDTRYVLCCDLHW